MNKKQRTIIEEDCFNILTDVSSIVALKNKSIFIIGGAGFIGSWLAELLAHLNDHHYFNITVTLLSRQPAMITQRAAHIVKRSDFKLIEGDVRHVNEIPNDTSYVIHAGTSPDYREHVSDPIAAMNTIIYGTECVLRACSRLAHLDNLLYLSSGLVYGSQPWKQENLSEDSYGYLNCTSASNVYAESKRAAEMLCQVYRDQFRMPIVIMRPFSFIGPYQLLNRPWAINNFIRDALHGGPIRILGDERTIRSYMYPSDMAYWILKALVSKNSGQVFNLGSPEGSSLRFAAETIARCFQNNIAIISSMPTEDSKKSRFIPDVSKAMNELKVTCNVNCEAAIRRTIQFFTS